MRTTLILPRHTHGTAPDARILAKAIAAHVKVPLSFEYDVNRGHMVVDLFTADPAEVETACQVYADPHGVAWEIAMEAS
jgi:tRNA A-37 threonylcarbamoyl transferase component Bud32